MRNALIGASVAVLLLAGCGGDAAPSTSTPEAADASSPGLRTTGPDFTSDGAVDSEDPIRVGAGTTQRPLSDRALIRDLWLGFSEAWKDGPAGAEQFLAENNYPAYQKDSHLCRESDEERGVRNKQFAFDEDTIEREENWTIPQGSLKGQDPPGRVYSMRVRQVVVGDEGRATVTGTSHVSIDGGKAYLFLDCARIASGD